MTTSTAAAPPGPRMVQGSITIMDPGTAQVLQVFSFQYNPDSLQRSVTAQQSSGQGQARDDALRLNGPAAETVRVEIEMDASDWLEHPDGDAASQAGARYGVLPQLAILEGLLSPSVAGIKAANRDADNGVLEIIGPQAPLTVFSWNRQRAVPVRITELTVLEEAFDTSLNPTRVKVTLSMSVLTTNDLLWTHPGTQIFLQHLTKQASLAAAVPNGSTGTPTAPALGA